ncbi:cysteine desulfurase [Caloramator sp. E03]|uniref:cysteine desulfurase family protein n=1 Tax=Caloramator sp. E03 TaxID=2576307 RepID=UPI001110E8AD|nr:cysteine desulfurase family protein [Caloramator sp. E03]QCX32774.1 cysteine desulfurase [Caloramator sp. E03]
MIYFDNSATTKPHREVIDEVVLCMEKYFGNPSSAHRLGIEAEKKMKIARENVAMLINAQANEIVFTSGGSEANNTAIKGIIKNGDHVITSKIEHPSVLRALKELEVEGVEVTYLDVDSRGVLNIDQLKNSIKDNTKLVTIMHVNNEIGSIQPIEEIIKIVRNKNKKTRVHVDAVQSAGKIKIDVKKLDVDLMSISAHKIHGPKGVGALYIKKGVNIRPLISGGGQERDIRSGTENLPMISAFGVAANIISDNIEQKIEHVNNIKKHFMNRLSEIEDVRINSPIDDVHIGNILNVSFKDIKGEVLLHALEDYEIYVSTGSACSAKKSSHKNYVLPAIGLNDCYISGAIRFSFSYLNTIDEVDKTIEALKNILKFLRRIKK